MPIFFFVAFSATALFSTSFAINTWAGSGNSIYLAPEICNNISPVIPDNRDTVNHVDPSWHAWKELFALLSRCCCGPALEAGYSSTAASDDSDDDIDGSDDFYNAFTLWSNQHPEYNSYLFHDNMVAPFHLAVYESEPLISLEESGDLNKDALRAMINNYIPEPMRYKSFQQKLTRDIYETVRSYYRAREKIVCLIGFPTNKPIVESGKITADFKQTFMDYINEPNPAPAAHPCRNQNVRD
jgi:hypothetical protein